LKPRRIVTFDFFALYKLLTYAIFHQLLQWTILKGILSKTTLVTLVVAITSSVYRGGYRKKDEGMHPYRRLQV